MTGKKNIAAVLAALLSAAALAGCQNKTSAPSEASSGDGGVKPTLKAVVTYKSGMDYNTYPVEAYLEKETGYKVQYDVLPASNPSDKLNAIMASGQDYDYIQVSDRNLYANYSQQGALTDLKPLVKQYGPNITKNISQSLLDIVTVNNTYFCVPSISPTGRKDTGNVNSGILIRQDLLDKIGVSMPTTIDEFETMLQQFKDKDPNSQGALNIPITTDQYMDLADNGVGGAFGIIGLTAGGSPSLNAWSVSSDKVVPTVELPGFKDYVAFLRDLYSKGLLDKEAPTNQGSTAQQKFTSGRAAAMMCGYYDIPTLMQTMAKTQPNAKLVYLQPVSGKYGKGSFPASSINAIDYYNVIPKTSKHAADVIKYFNLKLDANIFKGMVLGTENTDYTVKDGAYYPVLPTFFDDRGNANQYLTGTTKDYPSYWLARARKDDNQFAAYQKLNVDYASAAKVSPVADLPCAVYSEIAADSATLNNLTNQFIIQSVVNGLTDDSYNSFLSSWKSQGGDQIVKTVNTWYTALQKKK